MVNPSYGVIITSFSFSCSSRVSWFLLRLPVADVFQRQAEFVGVVFQHRLERLAGGFAELGIDFGVPLVNPRQELIEARQEGRESFGVPAFSFAGVVIGDQGRGLFKVIPPGPADHERRVASVEQCG